MRLKFALAALILPFAMPADAALTPGAVAPDFTAPGAMAGKPIRLSLKAALAKGPVVLYFFPAAYTPGCNAEAHAFAESLPDFTRAGATVIGMTAGNVDQLARFSSQYCAGKFAVAAASPAIAKAYDVFPPKTDGATAQFTTRTSYVIAPDGKILLAHSDPNPADHVRFTLAAVRRYRAAH